MRTTPLSLATAAITCLCLYAAPASAQEDQEQRHDHQDDHSHHHALHFTHPLIAESVSPDTKLRVDYAWQELEEESESELELEGEYAFHRAFSIEAGVHYHPETGDLGETHVMFKFANYAFEEQNILLGYGVELGLPTGSRGHGGHGHESTAGEHDHADPEDDIYEISPFLNAGLMAGRWELVAWTLFEIPTNQNLQENVGTELRYNASVLYHATPRIETLVEAHGQTGLSGLETERSVLNLAPGLRIRPFPERKLTLGAGASFPLTDDQEFHTRILLSAFYHF